MTWEESLVKEVEQRGLLEQLLKQQLMKKVLTLLQNLLINNKLYNIGTLGKPHSLNGYLYINHELFFRKLDFKNKKIYIHNKPYEVEEIKKHLKNRFLIKLKNINSIEEAEVLRNSKSYGYN